MQTWGRQDLGNKNNREESHLSEKSHLTLCKANLKQHQMKFGGGHD